MQNCLVFPNDIWNLIFQYCNSPKDLLYLSLTCTSIKHLTDVNDTWQKYYFDHFFHGLPKHFIDSFWYKELFPWKIAAISLWKNYCKFVENVSSQEFFVILLQNLYIDENKIHTWIYLEECQKLAILADYLNGESQKIGYSLLPVTNEKFFYLDNLFDYYTERLNETSNFQLYNLKTLQRLMVFANSTEKFLPPLRKFSKYWWPLAIVEMKLMELTRDICVVRSCASRAGDYFQLDHETRCGGLDEKDRLLRCEIILELEKAKKYYLLGLQKKTIITIIESIKSKCTVHSGQTISVSQYCFFELVLSLLCGFEIILLKSETKESNSKLVSLEKLVQEKLEGFFKFKVVDILVISMIKVLDDCWYFRAVANKNWFKKICTTDKNSLYDEYGPTNFGVEMIEMFLR